MATLEGIAISCTSFANPAHRAWQSIKNSFNLSFLNFGEVRGLVNADNDNKLYVHIHFADDIKFDHDLPEDKGHCIEYYNYLIELISARCSKSNNITIVAYSFWQDSNVVRHATNISQRYSIKKYFEEKLYNLRERHTNLYVLDLDFEFAKFGMDNCFSTRNFYFAQTRLSDAGFKTLIEALKAILERYHLPVSKVLLLDCDNTLWGGVVAEDGVNNLTLGTDGIGRIFLDFQKTVLRLKSEGVLIGLVSKNNEKDVWDVFQKNSNMLLTRDDIAISKINWDEKSKNIYKISQELSLSLDSFVFWDDNIIEREKVKIQEPNVIVVDVPAEIWRWPRLLATLFEFSRFYSLSEDAEKTNQYKARGFFIEESNRFSDEKSFLKSIEQKAIIDPISENNMGRAEQLCLKTNQFNFRTQRYKRVDLLQFTDVSDDYCGTASLYDKFASHGIVGVYCLRPLGNDILFVDNFLVSCRVLGRFFEHWLMNQIKSIAKRDGYKKLFVGYVQSAKNRIVLEFLLDYGFSEIETELIKSLRSTHKFISSEELIYSIDLRSPHYALEELYGH